MRPIKIGNVISRTRYLVLFKRQLPNRWILGYPEAFDYVNGRRLWRRLWDNLKINLQDPFSNRIHDNFQRHQNDESS